MNVFDNRIPSSLCQFDHYVSKMHTLLYYGSEQHIHSVEIHINSAHDANAR